MFIKSSQCVRMRESLTLHVQHHAVCDPLVAVSDDAGEFLLVGLTAWHNHIVASHRHSAVRVPGLLEGGFSLQPRLPLDHTRRFAIG